MKYSRFTVSVASYCSSSFDWPIGSLMCVRERERERETITLLCLFILFLLQVAVHNRLILYPLQQTLSLLLYSALPHLDPGPSDLTFVMFLDFLLMKHVPIVPIYAMCSAQIFCNEDLLLSAVEKIAGSSKVSS